ncbi:MAG: Gfo/Idh/MocA family oxidoreductase [Anaerolineae bacterium]|nr:Gfo/Idh/MocA family oxidoreductase [Anaerolineae bacterium]
MPQPIEAVLVGAGGRGFDTFGAYALQHPDEIRIVAVAEPVAEKCERFALLHKIDPKYRFSSHKELFARGQLAPALINTTGDRQHVAVSVPALQLGYHVMQEKPMATTPHDCVRIVQAAEAAHRVLQIGHVMRYAPFYVAVKNVIASGRIGEVVTVNHQENVVYWHMAHSFIRGKWRNLAGSSPMILAKSCHDMDFLRWVIDRPCERIVSFGSLTHYRRESVGPEIPDRCTDGCPIADACAFYAPRFYLKMGPGWPATDLAIDQRDLSAEEKLEALKTSPYGRCVYRCDNDVVDHQVAIMEFAGGITVTFTMDGFAYDGGRTMRYDGTRGTLRGREWPEELRVYNHLGDTEEKIEIQHVAGGHGGGDTGLMGTFVRAVRTNDPNVLTSARTSLESHLMCFAAEKSRLEGSIVDMAEYTRQIEAEVATEGS